jgi:RHS repeat-associated protein
MTTSNKITSITDYFPYGKVLREFNQERYLTTQHERDGETALDYRGARYYDCDVARFLSVDPLANKYPSMSTYNYVMGNPLMFIDPDGKASKGVFSDENLTEYFKKQDAKEETGWTDAHTYLNEVFGDPNGFNEMIAPIAATYQPKPSWAQLRKNYPTQSSAELYKAVFGDSYHSDTKTLHFGDAKPIDATNGCALKISITLLRCGVDFKGDFLASNGTFKEKGVILSSTSMKKHLTSKIFGAPKEYDLKLVTVDDVKKGLSGRNGIYIIIPRPGEFTTAVGHVTLWEGNDVILNDHNYLEQAAFVYFWEFK